MLDMDRAQLTKLTYTKLADPRFRERLKAVAPDGTRPITIAQRDDQMTFVLDDVIRLGGSSNVVVPFLNGVAVLTMVMDVGAHDNHGKPCNLIKGECTVGVFIERLRSDEAFADGGVLYGFVIERQDLRQDAGQAELVAVAG
jgi:hypothetical protein